MPLALSLSSTMASKVKDSVVFEELRAPHLLKAGISIVQRGLGGAANPGSFHLHVQDVQLRVVALTGTSEAAEQSSAQSEG
jgi:hypothetical protein